MNSTNARRNGLVYITIIIIKNLKDCNTTKCVPSLRDKIILPQNIIIILVETFYLTHVYELKVCFIEQYYSIRNNVLYFCNECIEN